jgi:ribonucleoside-diphosphate reductase alpha chain
MDGKTTQSTAGNLSPKAHLDTLILEVLRNTAYRTSVELAEAHGPFPLYDAETYLDAPFIRDLPLSIIESIEKHGIRNSHLLSIAPTGTISMCADNVSGGIEPVFANSTERDIIFPDGVRPVEVKDYAYEMDGKTTQSTAGNLSPKAHLDTLILAQRYVDSAISKTINVGDSVEWAEFKQIYMDAYEGGAKGCTTFRIAGKRFALLKSKDEEDACTYDPSTGVKTCDS